jgi:hypothetical protein
MALLRYPAEPREPELCICTIRRQDIPVTLALGSSAPQQNGAAALLLQTLGGADRLTLLRRRRHSRAARLTAAPTRRPQGEALGSTEAVFVPIQKACDLERYSAKTCRCPNLLYFAQSDGRSPRRAHLAGRG